MPPLKPWNVKQLENSAYKFPSVAERDKFLMQILSIKYSTSECVCMKNMLPVKALNIADPS